MLIFCYLFTFITIFFTVISYIFCSGNPLTNGSPILFLLYCADVTNIAECHGVTAHSYADDTQLYVHCTTGQCVTEAIVD